MRLMSRKLRSSSSVGSSGTPPHSQVLQFQRQRQHSDVDGPPLGEASPVCLVEADALAALARAGGRFMSCRDDTSVSVISRKMGGNSDSVSVFSLCDLEDIEEARRRLSPILLRGPQPLPLLSLRSVEAIPLDVLTAYFGVRLAHTMWLEKGSLREGDTVLTVWFEIPSDLREYNPMTVQPIRDLPTQCAVLRVLEPPASGEIVDTVLRGSGAPSSRLDLHPLTAMATNTDPRQWAAQKSSFRLLHFPSASENGRSSPDAMG